VKVALQQMATVTDVNEVKEALQQAATMADVDQVRVVVQQTAANVDQVKSSSSNLLSAHYRFLPILSGHQSRETIHKWLSPPDPSTNHNIACDTHHKKSASWFFQGIIFQEWKSSGSLLWVHGKRSHRRLFNLTPSNPIFHRSWLGKKRSVVCGYLIVPVRDD
jgi:hypothetical protein